MEKSRALNTLFESSEGVSVGRKPYSVHATLTLADGTRMAYLDLPAQAGSGDDAPTFLLLHGWAMCGDVFAPQHSLTRVGRVVIPDLRGHGDSEAGAPHLHTLSVMVADLGQLLCQLNLRRVIVIGWSMGASLGWRLMSGAAASAGRGRLVGMVSVDMSPRVLNTADWSLGLRGLYSEAGLNDTLAAIREDWPTFCGRFVNRIFAPDVEQDPRLLQWALTQAPEVMERFWRDLVATDLRSALEDVKGPHLVVYGEKSRLYGPDVAQYVANQVPDAQVLAFSQSGHAPHLEEPERFNRAVVAFASAALAEALDSPDVRQHAD